MKVTSRTVAPSLAPEETIEGVTTWSLPKGDRGDAEVFVYTSGGRVLGLSSTDGGDAWEGRAMGQLPGELDGSRGIVFLLRGRSAVVAEEYGLRGFVGRWDASANEFRDWELIERGDYHANHCSFPLALIEVEGAECLLHSTEWNRLDVTELGTARHVTTRRATENPGEEDQEPELDYFYGALHMSPDRSTFISGGWVWTPYDVLMAWSVSGYIAEPEAAGQSFDEPMTSGYNWDRPLAFVDNDTVAWAYNQRECVEGELPIGHPSELILHSISNGEQLERIPFDHFYNEGSPCGEVSGGLAFDTGRQQFVAYGPQHDTVVTDRAGKVLMTSPERLYGFCVAAHMGWRVESGKRLVVVHLTGE